MKTKLTQKERGYNVEVCRGDIYYVCRSGAVTGCEMETGRPAIIVSNNKGNECSEVVEVVYLTTQEKKPMPTHVEIMCKGTRSTEICEQINAVSKERLTDYACSCTAEEMTAIDKALLVSLGIEAAVDTDEAKVRNRLEEERNAYKQFYTKMEIERDTYKQLYQELVTKIVNRL